MVNVSKTSVYFFAEMYRHRVNNNFANIIVEYCNTHISFGNSIINEFSKLIYQNNGQTIFVIKEVTF